MFCLKVVMSDSAELIDEFSVVVAVLPTTAALVYSLSSSLV